MAPGFAALVASALLFASIKASPIVSTRQVAVAGFKYEGCYTEANGQRALSQKSYFDNAMTLEKCAAACTGFPLFGVEYGRECYCGPELNPGSTLKPDSDCSFDCPGNSGQKCGAGDHLNVYSSTAVVAAPPAYKRTYTALGCRSDSVSARTLTGYRYDSDFMTTELCATTCHSKQFRYFGVKYYRECYCGNEFATGSTELASSACTFPCLGNTVQTCGGDEKLNTYEFEAGDEVSLYVADSCYTEATTGRALSEFEYYDDAMTLEKCEATCTGFKYFGVEYGRECFCGNTLNAGSVPTAAGECNKPCPGNKAQTCGGGSRLNVYILKSSLPVSFYSTVASSSSTSSSSAISSYTTTSEASSSTSSSAISSYTTTSETPSSTSSSEAASSSTTTSEASSSTSSSTEAASSSTTTSEAPSSTSFSSTTTTSESSPSSSETTTTMTTTSSTTTFASPTPEATFTSKLVLGSGPNVGRSLNIAGSAPAYSLQWTSGVPSSGADFTLIRAGGQPYIVIGTTFKFYIRLSTSQYGIAFFTTPAYVTSTSFTWAVATCSVDAGRFVTCTTPNGFTRFLQCGVSIYMASPTTTPGGCIAVSVKTL